MNEYRERQLKPEQEDHSRPQESLFPLELVDFEHYMLADDSPNFPMTIPVSIEISGVPDREAFEDAFKATCKRHPFSSVRVEERKGRSFWVESVTPEIDWVDHLPDEVTIDLRKETGLKVFAKQNENGVSILFFIHHSVSDGGGIAQFVEDWLVLYGDPSSESETGLSHLDVNYLRKRGKLGMSWWRYLLRPIQEFCGAVGVIEYFSHRPVAIGPQRFGPSFSLVGKPKNRRFVFKFSRSETKELIGLSKKTRFPINDLLLAAFYSACQTWLEINRPEDSDRHLRMMVPMNLRTKSHSALPMCNFVSMIFLDRKPGRSKSVRNVCWYVWLEMSTIKMMRLGYTFIHMIRILRCFGLLPRLLRRDRSIATSVLSNMGRLFSGSKWMDEHSRISSGGLTLDSIAMFPPVREFSWISAVVSTYGGEMQFNCSYCEDAISKDDFIMIMESLKQNLLCDFEMIREKSSV